MKNELAYKRIIEDIKKLNAGFIKVLKEIEADKNKDQKKAA